MDQIWSTKLGFVDAVMLDSYICCEYKMTCSVPGRSPLIKISLNRAGQTAQMGVILDS
jgi:hypothetical protein